MLALAAFGQAIAQGRGHTVHATDVGGSAPYAVALGLLALATTVPLIFLRPVAAAVAITAASVLMVVGSGALTVAGLAAQVLASYRLGRTRGFGRAAPVGDAGGRPDRSGHVGRRPAGHRRPGRALPRARARRPRRRAGDPAGRGCPGRGRGRDRAAGPRRGCAAEHRPDVLADTLADHLARGERARIARELHDVVAHHISMIAVQAETARLTTPGLPAAGAQRLAEIGDTARAGLTEMRRLLGVLREDAGGAAATGTRSPACRSWLS